MKVRPRVLFPLLLSALLAASALSVARAQPTARVRVVTSIPIFADFIRQVGADRVEVLSVVPGGGEVHTFEPTPADLRTILSAHLILLNGRGLDEHIAHAARQGSAPIWNLSAGLLPVDDPDTVVFGPPTAEEEGHEGGNPHLWMDPIRAVRYVERTRDALSTVDPAAAAMYTDNASRYIGRLYALNAEVADVLVSIPTDRRNLITFHDAFPAFAQRYELRIIGLVLGDPEEREPSAQQLAELSRTIRAWGVRTVFTEPQFSARALELVARDLGVQTVELYADTFAGDIQSYEDLIRTNALRIAGGLR
jgi:manganese/iron transport system substrate-binding protein